MAFGLDDVLNEGLKLVNKFIPDPAKQAEAALEVARMKQAGEFKVVEAQLVEMAEVTKRLDSDTKSDSWLAKNIRPLIMIYLLVLVTLLGFNLIVPTEGFTAMIRSFTEYGLMFYFGGRTLEKAASTISDALTKVKGK